MGSDEPTKQRRKIKSATAAASTGGGEMHRMLE
jgi:hypothetical protein